MGQAETFRREAERLYDLASVEPNWEKEQGLIGQAEHLENIARELEDEPISRSKLGQELEATTDPYLRVKIQSALDNLYDFGPSEDAL